MVAHRCSQATIAFANPISLPWNGWSGGPPQVGDRAIVVITHHASNPSITPPSGWSQHVQQTATGASNNVITTTFIKELVAGDIGVDWLFTQSASWYISAVASVYTPSNILTWDSLASSPTNYYNDPGPYNPANYGNFHHPALTLSKAALVVLTCGIMRNTTTGEAGPIPFGNSVGVTTTPVGATAHHATYMGALIHHVQSPVGTIPRYQVSNYAYQSSFVVGAIALVEKNALPVATVVAPNGTAADPRNALTLDWTYADTEGQPQAQSQVRYRVKGTSTWTELAAVATAVSERTWAAGASPFVLGTEYEWAVRVNDGTDWGDWSATAWFMAGVDIWHYSSNVASATAAYTIAAAELIPGEDYIFQVRTADAEGFGPWSASGTFVYAPYLLISPTGIASAEAFGTPIVKPTITLSPGGIATEEAFGNPTLYRYITLAPAGIASAEAFGTPTIIAAWFLSPVGIPSAEAFGNPTVLPGAVTISQAGGIASAEMFGVPNIAQTQVLIPVGIVSEEAFGQPTINAYIILSPEGIASEEAVGTPALIPSTVTLVVTGIASAEAFGIPYVQPPGFVWIYVTESGLSVVLIEQPDIELIPNSGSIVLLESGSMEIVANGGQMEVVPVALHVEIEESM